MTRSKKTTIIVCICIVCICTFVYGIVRGDRGTKPFAELKTQNIVRVRTAFEQPDGSHYVLDDKEVGTLADYLRKVRINGERSDPAIDGGFIGMFYLDMKDGSTVMVSASWNYFTYGDDLFNADLYEGDGETIDPISDMYFELLDEHGSDEDKEFLMRWDSR